MEENYAVFEINDLDLYEQAYIWMELDKALIYLKKERENYPEGHFIVLQRYYF